jgi:hypothetical protein
MVPVPMPAETTSDRSRQLSGPPCLLHDPQRGFQVVNAKREVQHPTVVGSTCAILHRPIFENRL